MKKNNLRLEFSGRWFDAHPLSRADLEEEIGNLRELGFDLSVK